jgi:hypothetical protein
MALTFLVQIKMPILVEVINGKSTTTKHPVVADVNGIPYTVIEGEKIKILTNKFPQKLLSIYGLDKTYTVNILEGLDELSMLINTAIANREQKQ